MIYLYNKFLLNLIQGNFLVLSIIFMFKNVNEKNKNKINIKVNIKNFINFISKNGDIFSSKFIKLNQSDKLFI